MYAHALKCYGPLSEVIQVKGALALMQIENNGMFIDTVRMERVFFCRNFGNFGFPFLNFFPRSLLPFFFLLPISQAPVSVRSISLALASLLLTVNQIRSQLGSQLQEAVSEILKHPEYDGVSPKFSPF
jgi:hypothetical protein